MKLEISESISKKKLEDYKNKFEAKEKSEGTQIPKDIDFKKFLGCGG